LTGRRKVEPVDAADLTAANAGMVEGQLEAMRGGAADEARVPIRSLDPYAYVDLVRKGERCQPIANPDSAILG
jgi:hypothetical protein